MSKANGDGREDEAGVQNEQKTQHARLSSTALRLLACLLRLFGLLAARMGTTSFSEVSGWSDLDLPAVLLTLSPPR